MSVSARGTRSLPQRPVRSRPSALALLASVTLAAAASFVTTGCATKPPQHGEHGGVTVPRSSAPLDLKKLADEIGHGAPPLTRIWATLPEGPRKGIEQRLSSLKTIDDKAQEIERRQGVINLDDSGTAFAELFYLLEEVSFGPPSDAQVDARAALAGLYGIARTASDASRWAEKLASELGVKPNEEGLLAFLKRFAAEGDGQHRAFVVAVLRQGKPTVAVGRALLAHAQFLANKRDYTGALAMREHAVKANPTQSAENWVALATAYTIVLDADRAAIALKKSEGAPVGSERPAEIGSSREKVQAKITLVRRAAALGVPKTPEDRLMLGELYLELGDLDRAEPLLKEAARELPQEARPTIALGRLRFARTEARDFLVSVREVLAILEPARKLARPTNDLYEMTIGLSGLTAVEDTMRGSKEPTELIKRATVTVARLRELNDEHRALSPQRAAMLDVALDLAKEAIAKGPDFADHMSTMLAHAAVQARGVAARYPDEPNARKLAITLAVFAPDATEAATYVLAEPKIPDEAAFIVTRAEIAVDIGKSLDDAGIISRARALVTDGIPDVKRRDPRALVLLGDAELLLSPVRQGSLQKAEALYRDAVTKLPPPERSRVIVNLAWVIGHTGQIQQVPDMLREAINAATKDADRVTAISSMATFALMAGQPEDAAKLATQALAVDDKAFLPLVCRAIAQKRLGHPEAGKKDAAAAIERIEKGLATYPRKQWGQAGVYGDSSLDVNLGIGSLRQQYELRMVAYHRPWALFENFDVRELRAIAATPDTPVTPEKPPVKGKKPGPGVKPATPTKPPAPPKR